MPLVKPLSPTDANIRRCADLLREGAPVAVPTETVYGLAADARNEDAVRRIFAVKGRPLIDPLIVHCANLAALRECAEAPTALDRLAEAFWPGPLTVVLPKKPGIPGLVTAGLPSVAVRIPAHPLFRRLLAAFGGPLAAPSANPFGYVSPTRAEHVARTLGKRISAVLDGGACEHGVESTILDLRTPEQPRVLRHGPVDAAMLEAVLGIGVESAEPRTEAARKPAIAPGQLSRHYSPRTTIRLFGPGEAPPPQVDRNVGPAALLRLRRPPGAEPGDNVFWLAEDGDLSTAAHNLYDLLQRLDARGYACLYVERPENTGIGRAINDRLARAAADS